jgi:hypothetical protein
MDSAPLTPGTNVAQAASFENSLRVIFIAQFSFRLIPSVLLPAKHFHLHLRKSKTMIVCPSPQL